MKITYAITVCNESRDLYSLISFLKGVIDDEDDINVLVDTAHSTESVKSVIDYFKEDIVTCERAFDGNFADHRNYHISKCSGDYIFVLDPDEMPQELMIKNVKEIITSTEADFFMVPRINIVLGATRKWYEDHDFGDKINELGWVNWPDYNGRIFKNNGVIKYSNALHEKIQGFKSMKVIVDNPRLALYHIKSVDKDNNRWSNGSYVSPKNDNLYDKLM
jgi:hypothetical protein